MPLVRCFFVFARTYRQKLALYTVRVWSMRESNPRPNNSSNDLTVNIVKELYTLLRLHTLLVTPQLERYTSYTNFHILLGQYNSIVCSFQQYRERSSSLYLLLNQSNSKVIVYTVDYEHKALNLVYNSIKLLLLQNLKIFDRIHIIPSAHLASQRLD